MLACAGDRTEEELLAPGDVWMPGGMDAAALEGLLDGQALTPLYWKDPSLGWRMLTAAPVDHTGGDVSAYIVVEQPMDQAAAQERDFLVSGAAGLSGCPSDRNFYAGDPPHLHPAHPPADQGGPGL